MLKFLGIRQSQKISERRWEESLRVEVTTSRPIASYREAIYSLELHAFGDASTHGVGAAVYSIVRQRGGITQTLVTGKARLAKKDLTTPRLELIAAHMAANLVINMKNGLKDLPEPQSMDGLTARWPCFGYWETASIANLLQTEYAK